MSEDLRFSRLYGSALELTDASFDPQRFVEQPVLLTGTVDVLATDNGHEMVRCSLLLLMRITKLLTVALPSGQEALEHELRELALQHAWDETPCFARLPVDLPPFAAILSVGGSPRADLPLTIVTSDGWTLRASSTAAPVNQTCSASNPVGALAAASLGVGEVFKRLLKLRDDKGSFLDGYVFSLWSYAADDTPEPVLPEVIDVDLLVAGGGAIGNGVVHLLSLLPLRGHCVILDRQTYADENWGTCLRLTRAAAKEEPKAAFLAGLFTGDLVAHPIQGRVEELENDPDWRTPPVVLSCFDNVEARHAVQDLWPDLIIDGAIGQRLECQVSAHPWSSHAACLRCIFEAPTGERAEVVQQRMTGLAPAALTELTRPLSEADVAAAAPEKQEWLAAQIGTPICSVVEAASALSTADMEATFRPSVPFVATLSACMMATELVRYFMTGTVGVEPRFFFSVLLGPQLGDHYPEDRHQGCMCVTRAANIERIRATRSRA